MESTSIILSGYLNIWKIIIRMYPPSCIIPTLSLSGTSHIYIHRHIHYSFAHIMNIIVFSIVTYPSLDVSDWSGQPPHHRPGAFGDCHLSIVSSLTSSFLSMYIKPTSVNDPVDSASDRKLITILVRPLLIGTPVSVICASTISPTLNCIGSAFPVIFVLYACSRIGEPGDVQLI